jgi:hypothetical protein
MTSGAQVSAAAGEKGENGSGREEIGPWAGSWPGPECCPAAFSAIFFFYFIFFSVFALNFA